MAEYGRSLAQEVQHLTAKVKTLLNAELKDICRGESLQVSGVKAALQKRIIDRMLAPQPSSMFLPCNKNSAELRSLKFDDGAPSHI